MRKFLATREQLYVDVLDAMDDSCVMLFMPSKSLYILRVVLRYARRRINWVQSVIDDCYFNVPDSESWDTILSLCAYTEECLMNTCDTQDIVDALDCICRNTALVAKTAWDKDFGEYIDQGKLLPGKTIPGVSMPVWIDEEACGVAQNYWAWTHEMMTEIVIPAATFTFDYVIPAAAAAFTVATGGGGVPVALAAYAIAELIQELMEIAWDSATSNLTNWLYAVKEEWVCAAYDVLRVSGTDTQDVANAVWEQVIEPTSSISEGDKAIVKMFGGVWAMESASKIFQTGSVWSTEHITPGFCLVCPEDLNLAWTFPASCDTWTIYTTAICDELGAYLPVPYSNWNTNYSPVFEVDAGIYDVSGQIRWWVDGTRWDFPPSVGDQMIKVQILPDSGPGGVGWWKYYTADGLHTNAFSASALDLPAGQYRFYCAQKGGNGSGSATMRQHVEFCSIALTPAI